MKILFIRHAETPTNVNKLTHKTGDPIGLTELGQQQTKQLTEVCKNEKVEVIFFGTDIERFNPKKFDPDFKKSISNGTSQWVISTRNHEEVYKIEELIEAVPIVLKKIPETLFLIGGSGSLTKKYEERAAALNVSPRIRFLGRLSQDELPRYLSAADVYVSTAVSDAGLASSTSEAMASCVPAVITNVVDNGKWIQSGVNGFMYAPKNSEDLAEKIIELLNSQTLRKQF